MEKTEQMTHVTSRHMGSPNILERPQEAEVEEETYSVQFAGNKWYLDHAQWY